MEGNFSLCTKSSPGKDRRRNFCDLRSYFVENSQKTILSPAFLGDYCIRNQWNPITSPINSNASSWCFNIFQYLSNCVWTGNRKPSFLILFTESETKISSFYLNIFIFYSYPFRHRICAYETQSRKLHWGHCFCFEETWTFWDTWLRKTYSRNISKCRKYWRTI